MMHLYVIKTYDGERVKIGISDNPQRRFTQIQAHSPVELVLCYVHAINSARRCENYLHKVFWAQHIHGEWFRVPAYRAVREAKAAIKRFPDRKGEHQNEWRETNVRLIRA